MTENTNSNNVAFLSAVICGRCGFNGHYSWTCPSAPILRNTTFVSPATDIDYDIDENGLATPAPPEDFITGCGCEID